MISRYRAASTPQAREVVLARRLLCGPNRSAAERCSNSLPGKIGYADLDRLPAAGVDDMFDRFKDTRAIIFDMRAIRMARRG